MYRPPDQRLPLTLPPFGERPWAELRGELMFYGVIMLTSFVRLTPPLRRGAAETHNRWGDKSAVMHTAMLLALVFAASLLWAAPLAAQQHPDTLFRVVNASPAFSRGSGERVCLDEAHNNFQSASRNPGSYEPFVALLEGDGYRVRALGDTISMATLRNCNLFVVVGALGANDDHWSRPRVSAFSPAEIGTIDRWIREGGSFLMITDHAPVPGAVAHLAERLGIIGIDGLARLQPDTFPDVFARSRGEIVAHAIFRGRTVVERVDSVASFHGEAFRASDAWAPLLRFSDRAIAYIPMTDQLRAEWPHFAIDGWLHAAARRMGKGRVVWLGEQSICTALLGPLGMGHPQATQNAQYCLNVVHWLSGLLDD